MTVSAPGASISAQDKGFFGHPRGLSTLFFTELWERFSFYGMKAILGLYLWTAVAEGGLGVDKALALSVVAIYGTAVYMSGVAGGWLADRVWGGQRSVFYGGVLIMLGHIALALPIGLAGVYTGLVFIVLGTGLLKPNISTVVGGLYEQHDNRRDAGFTIFYMAINIGGFISPLITGALADGLGFHWGFSVAAVGMALGLVQYRYGRKNLRGSAAVAPNPLPAQEKGRTYGLIGLIAAAIVGLGVVAFFLGGVEGVILMISIMSIVLPIGYFTVMLRSKKTLPHEKPRVIAYIPLFIAAAMFWLIFEQSASVIAEFADSNVDNHVFGWEFPVAWFQSINPIMIILLAPVFALLWVKLKDRAPSTPRKFAGALVLVGLSFVLMYFASNSAADGKVTPLWLVVMFLIMTAGELMLSPVGLSVTTKLAPKAFASQTMGLWFLASSAGTGVAAQLVKFYTTSPSAYFLTLGGAAVVLGVGLAVAAPAIKKLMSGVE
ncbi:peptide MFS transporter [Lentzea flaviverrucosa]|uniref:Proton-dependent oligopeptide transporter, POT family n=1 Tax=Lentzea flaviverrucosa TaxID=200379 RepID=A0A1H9SY89_9PSEU|nr:peptide MFS transporter [Lentzea flaviverrucosa]RDI25555.1 POT family proton-dependent oligopeptide transporter [Lentzea flaviverrucosa]SER89353.1 proton-dependent oligopeptide transporter, POT family [Lentzea flaviverrucosa]